MNNESVDIAEGIKTLLPDFESAAFRERYVAERADGLFETRLLQTGCANLLTVVFTELKYPISEARMHNMSRLINHHHYHKAHHDPPQHPHHYDS